MCLKRGVLEIVLPETEANGLPLGNVRLEDQG